MMIKYNYHINKIIIYQSMSRKQNRCVEHSQEIVALCIEEDCKEKVKAVCPLELYNDHLDHKF